MSVVGGSTVIHNAKKILARRGDRGVDIGCKSGFPWVGD